MVGTGLDLEYDRKVTSVQLQTKPESRSIQELRRGLATLHSRAQAMGALPAGRIAESHDQPTEGAGLRRLVEGLRQADLLASANVDLAPLLVETPQDLDTDTAERMLAQVNRMVEALDHSPSPRTEWAPMRATLGDEALGLLVGVAEVSLRRYAAGTRQTPQRIAERLHWLALVVADLAGGYNDFGIRRWFERPRSQLQGQSPRQTLGEEWGVDDAAALRVRALASALTGAQALAV